jgi:precorrin-6B methylase 2
MWQTKFGRCIYTSPSGYKLYDNYFYRWLTLGSSALQSVINKRNPKKPILYYLPALTLMARAQPDRCCLLGVGGASVAQILSTSTHAITAVDSSEEILDIAQRFFMADKIPNLSLVHQNASLFLEDTQEQYPHLIIDLYDDRQFPKECNNDRFFQACQDKLSRDGFLAINLANFNEQWAIFALVKKHFKNTLVFPIKKSANMVIIASNHDERDVFINNLLLSKEVKRIQLVTDWGYVGE